MKSFYLPSSFLFISLIIFICAKNYAQMPPHPALLERIERGEITKPYTLSNMELVRSKGVDQPWSALKLQNLKKPNILSREFGLETVPTGNWKALAILVQFSDKPSQVNPEYFDNLLFGQNTGTLHDYYEKVSYGNLDIITVDLPSSIDWATAPQTYTYYVNGQNGMGGYPQNSQKLVEDVVNIVNPQTDFSEYDNDGDGYVDDLFIIHSGTGADYSGNNNDMWSHSWVTRTIPILDGVKIYHYSIEPEYWEQPVDMTCGVFAHEMGHSVFGLPDLYDTDYSSYGLGSWSLMASGSWNGTLGNSPAFPDAWSHIQMGYLNPTIIFANINGQSINNVENNPEAYFFQNSLCGSEYFLVENRQQISYDTYLSGNGLCIYHIDNSVGNNKNEWYPGHTSSGHYRVALEQANGLWRLEQKRGSDNGDLYPGFTDNRDFANWSVPDSRTYSSNITGIEVSNISPSSLIMSADFKLDSQDTLAQFNEQTSISLKGVSESSVAWGDYNNDGYLDLIVTGNIAQYSRAVPFSKIYLNNGDNTFTEQNSISLTGVFEGSAAWGDYDNDGYLDILLTGADSYQGTQVSKIYHNNGNNTFAEQTSINLYGYRHGSAVWGDYDNDGYLDILLAGGFISKIYHNNRNNTFTEETSISLPNFGNGSAAWGDYDNDGDLDIILTGSSSTSFASKVYRNNGDNTFTNQTSISLAGVWQSSAAWGDYDNDGYLDILLTGSSSNTGGSPISKAYHNNGDNTFTELTSPTLTGVRISSVAWGDYDNDGYLDIFETGFAEAGHVSKIYHNNRDNTFTEQDKVFIKPGAYYASAVWGDYDNDNDLDIILSGNIGFKLESNIFRNNNEIENGLPSVPSNLLAEVKGNNVVFSWNKSTDNETPQSGLTYNLMVGTSPGACDILSPMSDVNTGKRRIVSIGNAGHCSTWTIKGLAPGKYYWSVQAIDNAFAASNFAPEQNFTIQSPGTIVINSPKGGEVFAAGSNPIITYSSVGNSGHINLDYSIDGGTSWDTIATYTIDDGDWKSWTVPNTPSRNCKIKISDSDGDPSVISDSVFAIQAPGTIVITYPKAGEIFEVGSNPVITYSSMGNSGHINLDYSTNGGTDWINIAANTEDDGDWRSWTIPNTPSVNCKIKISDSDGDPIAISDGLFTIMVPQFTEQTLISLKGSPGTWGDYDNDGDLDILLLGFPSKIYRNNGDNTFSEQTSIHLEGGNRIAWGDYDSDSDLDILITISSGSKIYRNNGDNSFTEQTPISTSYWSVSCGDYDNDGDLDLLLSGDEYGGEPHGGSTLYRNDGDSTFTPLGFSYICGSSSAWGDYDNDGDLDVIISGYTPGTVGHPETDIYRNNGDNTFTIQTSMGKSGPVAWGDYDNDGDLDILFAGSIYRNNGDNTFTEQTSIPLISFSVGSGVWGDYDNDGNLDILMTGIRFLNPGWERLSKVYHNNGDNTFTEETSISLTGVNGGSAEWGDYDNDGDLDILLTGSVGDSTITKIYRNNCSKPNTLPSAPSNLKVIVNGNNATFSWNKSYDNETLQNGLRYNLVVGTRPESVDISSPMSDRNTGYRRIVDLGNTNHDTSWTIKELSPMQYYWSVQAIDNSFAGSNFAPEQNFIIQVPGTIIITCPKGGEEWEAGSHPVITYSSLGNSGHLNLDYSIDGGITWDSVATNTIDDGDWKSWTVPNTPSTNCKIRISDTDGDPVVISDSLFTIIGVIPVELVSFTAKANENKIMLNWETATEVNNYGFEVERRLTGTEKWERIGFVKGNGSVTTPETYQYLDRPVGGSKFQYRLKQIDVDGGINYSEIAEVSILPTKYELSQNYPNPFNPRTTIEFSVPEASELRINVYSILGEKILTVAEGEYEPGYYKTELDAANLPSGIYIYRIESNKYIQAKKMIILK